MQLLLTTHYYRFAWTTLSNTYRILGKASSAHQHAFTSYGCSLYDGRLPPLLDFKQSYRTTSFCIHVCNHKAAPVTVKFCSVTGAEDDTSFAQEKLLLRTMRVIFLTYCDPSSIATQTVFGHVLQSTLLLTPHRDGAFVAASHT